MAVWRTVRALPSWLLPLVLAVVVLLLPLVGLEFSLSRQIQLGLILALLVSGLNLSHGYAGELAIGQAAMYAAGAYTAGLLSTHGHTDVLVQMVAAGLVALVVGVVTGVPGLRLNSWSLAMTSFFLVLLVPDVLAMFDETTGGHNGLAGIAPGTLFGHMLDGDDFYMLVVAVVIVWFAVFRNLVTSRHGIAFRVLKQSPVLASSVGISVFRMKLLGYAVGAIPAGFAGALFANLDLYLSPASFGFVLATTVLAASILGGAASVYGALVGAAIMQFLTGQSTDFSEYALVFYGIFLILGGVLLSGGLARLGRLLVARLDRAAALPGTPVLSTEAVVPALPGALLRVRGVEKSFGGNRALRGVELTAEPGKVTALIGPNGSGKTTLLNAICGFYRIDDGSIELGGDPLQGVAPHRAARLGVARTFQTPAIPAGVTVLEAVAAGRYSPERVSMASAVLRLPRFRAVRRNDTQRAEEALALVGMLELRDSEAVALPLGMRRLLEVARALVSEPRVLLLDECASGLDEDEVQRLAGLIRAIRDAGGTVVLVEHNFRLVLELADEIHVLAQGEVIASGPPSAIERDPRVLAEYLGGAADDVVAEVVAELDEGDTGKPSSAAGDVVNTGGRPA
jgi:branched-chain amino acid transport system permease protein